MLLFKRFYFILIFSLLFIQCAKENNYLIEKGKIGKIDANTKIEELKLLFVNDSISIHKANNDSKENEKLFSFDNDEYEIFSADGKKILEITPVTQNDSTSKIKSIQIFDPQFKTESGINLHSTFKDIYANYSINKVETTLTSATLFIDELNATIAIDKSDLGLSRFSREEISIDQIPDIAKIKYFTIWLN